MNSKAESTSINLGADFYTVILSLKQYMTVKNELHRFGAFMADKVRGSCVRLALLCADRDLPDSPGGKPCIR